MTRKVWTPEKEKRALKLKMEGKTAREIGEAMGIPRGTVLNRLWMLGKGGGGSRGPYAGAVLLSSRDGTPMQHQGPSIKRFSWEAESA